MSTKPGPGLTQTNYTFNFVKAQPGRWLSGLWIQMAEQAQKETGGISVERNEVSRS